MAIVGPTLIGSGGQGRENADGGYSHTLVFVCDEFDEVPQCGPTVWEGLPRKRGGRSWEKSRERGGRYVVSVLYEGPPPGQTETERWRMVPSKSDEPKEAHPWIDYIADRFSGEEQDDGTIHFPRYLPAESEAASPDGLNLNKRGDGRVKNPMFGWDTYIKKAMTVRLQFRYRDLPQRYLEIDGTVIDKIPNAKFDLWPDRDWLVWCGEIEEVGEGEDVYYEGAVDFVLSIPGGWPPMYWLIDRLQ